VAHDGQERRLESAMIAFRVAAILLVLEVVSWVIDLAAK